MEELTHLEAEIEMSSETFNDFLRCLTNFIGVSNDIDIYEGMIRQRSDDNTSIFEMNLKELFDNEPISLAITNIKQKIDLLKTFQGNAVKLSITNRDYSFSDDLSSVRFLNPSREFLENTYMSDEEIENTFTTSDDQLLLSVELPSLVTERIKVVSQNFGIFAIQVNFDGEVASINAATQSKDQFAKFIHGIEMNMVLENSSSNITTLPFKMDHDTDIKFDMYKDPNQNVALNKLTTTLGDVDIVVYLRAHIMENN